LNLSGNSLKKLNAIFRIKQYPKYMSLKIGLFVEKLMSLFLYINQNANTYHQALLNLSLDNHNDI